MDISHQNELVALSQEIYDLAADKITNYCSARYCGIGMDTMEQQMEDYLFVARETGIFLFGNALALLAPESQEAEIKAFTDSLKKVIRYARQQAGGDTPPC